LTLSRCVREVSSSSEGGRKGGVVVRVFRWVVKKWDVDEDVGTEERIAIAGWVVVRRRKFG
jgi:hypothetical protein